MTLRQLYEYCAETSKAHPEHSDEIYSFYDLAKMEVEDGESEANECELAFSDIEELINE